jgi:hypothetical protein
MMSALPPKADIERFGWNVCLVPIADTIIRSLRQRGRSAREEQLDRASLRF